MDIPTLLKAVDNESNLVLLDLTHSKIKKMNLDVLKELGFHPSKLAKIMQSLDAYRYVDTMNDLKYGAYIRWITIPIPSSTIQSNGNGNLTKGAIFCELKINDDGVYVVYKNFYHKHYQFKLDDCLVFQKLSRQEEVLLYALDHIQDNTK